MFNLIYITFPNEEEAKKMADLLLEQKLVACANIFPITSAYWWNGAVQNEGEFVAIVKTQPKLWERVRDTIEAEHSYETPCITKWEAEANRAYELWIVEATGGM